MKVLVHFYAQLRDLAGRSEMEIDFTANATVGDLLEEIYERIPALRSHDKSILTGAGVDFVDRDYQVRSGDTISVMPPVQGG